MSAVLDLYTPEHWSRLPPPTVFRGWLTGVGSRDTPPNACRLLTIFAGVTYSLGYQWRSGGAKGADEAIEHGVLTHPHYRPGTALTDLSLEIYLPWNGFAPIQGGPKKYEDFSRGYINTPLLSPYEHAKDAITYYHPLGDRIREKRGVWALHTRNMFQPLGQDLKTPSERLYCWAPLKGEDDIEGGTRTAWQVARKHRIPTVNLYNGDAQSRLLAFLAKYAQTALT